MKLENRITVPASADTAWEVLLDIERIAPCMPGATLTEVDGDDFRGKVEVELGPINLTYGGTARIVSRDDAARVAVIEVSGEETGGTGTAKATITFRLHERSADATEVEVDTDLTITGKPAQSGRGVLAEVGAKLVDQLAACLAEEIGSDGTPATAPEAGEDRAGEQTEGSGTQVVQGPTPPAGDGVGAGADGAAAAAAVVAADAADAPGETVDSAPAAASAPSGGTEGLATGPAGPGVPVTDREASPDGAREGQPTTPTTSPTAAPGPRRSAEAIDLLDTAAAPVAKRLLPVVLGIAVLVAVVRRLLR